MGGGCLNKEVTSAWTLMSGQEARRGYESDHQQNCSEEEEEGQARHAFGGQPNSLLGTHPAAKSTQVLTHLNQQQSLAPPDRGGSGSERCLDPSKLAQQLHGRARSRNAATCTLGVFAGRALHSTWSSLCFTFLEGIWGQAARWESLPKPPSPPQVRTLTFSLFPSPFRTGSTWDSADLPHSGPWIKHIDSVSSAEKCCFLHSQL